MALECPGRGSVRGDDARVTQKYDEVAHRRRMVGASSRRRSAQGCERSAKRRHRRKDVSTFFAARLHLVDWAPAPRNAARQRPGLPDPAWSSPVSRSSPRPQFTQIPARHAPDPARAPCGRPPFRRAHGFPPSHIASSYRAKVNERLTPRPAKMAVRNLSPGAPSIDPPSPGAPEEDRTRKTGSGHEQRWTAPHGGRPVRDFSTRPGRR
jgi:hypothetical protein